MGRSARHRASLMPLHYRHAQEPPEAMRREVAAIMLDFY